MASLNSYKYKFTVEPDSSLLCAVCLEVAEDPKQHDKCGRLFCKACLERYGRDKACPNCREVLPQYFEDNRGKRAIKALSVRCNGVDSGCKWEGTLGALPEHLVKCEFTEAPSEVKKDSMPEKVEMNYEDVCNEISAAIEKGAPTYNIGDHISCYNIYKLTAEKIVEECSLGGVKKELQSALEVASKQQTFTKRAWTMRHAFDAILDSDIDTTDFSDGDKAKISMSYNDACKVISTAISKGAPTYNEGDHRGCYQTYKQAAENIVAHCAVRGVRQRLTLALEAANDQDTDTSRAWTMRDAFDAILVGQIVNRLGGDLRLRGGSVRVDEGPSLASFAELLGRRGTL